MATRTWIGGTANNDVTNPANWSGGAVPVAGDTAIAKSGTLVMPAGSNLNGVTLDVNEPYGDPAIVVDMTGNNDLTVSNVDGQDGQVVVNASGAADTLIVSRGFPAGVTATVNVAANTNLTLNPNTKQSELYGQDVVTVNGGITTLSGNVTAGEKVVLNTNLVGTGTLVLDDAVDADGTVTQSSGEINGSVAAGVNIEVNGTGSADPGLNIKALPQNDRLKIDAPASFAGNLLINVGTVILENFTANGVTFANGVMSFYDNGSFVRSFNVAPSGTLASGTGIFATQVGANMQILTEPTSYTGGLPPPGVFPLGPPNNFMVSDQTTGGAWQSQGTAYTGPVPGLASSIIVATSDNINVKAGVQNVFIHTGSGEEALDVSMVNGNNVLDGSTGSNFLVGGTGNDTFFVDDRGAPAAIWSTVVNFHAGDSATVWGVSPSDFGLTWMDGQGAAGSTGLTLTATAPGKPTAMLTLAGLTSADLTNGKLAINFGTDAASGSNYMLIHGA